MSFTNVVFCDQYQNNILDVDNKDVQKLEQAIYVHGYRGASKKKHNGVVPIKDSDTKLLKKYYHSINKYDEQMLEIFRKGTPVKVVAHVPNGNRLIGCMINDGPNLTLHILDIANYSGKLSKC